MGYLHYVFWIIVLFIILIVIIIKDINLNHFKKNKKFNLKNLPVQDEIINFSKRKINEVKYASKIHVVNVLFLDEKGHFYLGGGEISKVKNQHTVSFFADKYYEKQYNPSNISKVFHKSFKAGEEALVFDPFHPQNIILKPSLNEKNKSLMLSKQKYDNARLNLESGIIHSMILGLDSNTLRIILFFFIAGICFGLVIGWYLTIKIF